MAKTIEMQHVRGTIAGQKADVMDGLRPVATIGKWDLIAGGDPGSANLPELSMKGDPSPQLRTGRYNVVLHVGAMRGHCRGMEYDGAGSWWSEGREIAWSEVPTS